MSDVPTYADRQTGRVYRDALEMINDYILRFGQSVNVELDPLDGEASGPIPPDDGAPHGER